MILPELVHIKLGANEIKHRACVIVITILLQPASASLVLYYSLLVMSSGILLSILPNILDGQPPSLTITRCEVERPKTANFMSAFECSVT